MKDNKIKGNWGEDLACLYLIENGYNILERNLTFKFGEVDVVAIKDGVLTFFEVKSRSNLNFGFPSEAVDFKKITKITKVAKSYISNTSLDYNEISFDVIEVYLNDNKINHIERAF